MVRLLSKPRRLLKKFSVKLPHEPANPLLGKENVCPHKNTHVNVYRAIVRNGRKVQTTEMPIRCINKMQAVHTVERDSATKGNEHGTRHTDEPGKRAE